MPLFVISWTDKPGALDLRLNNREAHLAYAAGLGGRVKLGGPFLDAEGQMNGSLLIVEADSLEDAQALHAEDPYRLAGLMDKADIRLWRVTLNGFD